MVLTRLKRALSLRTRARTLGRWAVRYWGGYHIVHDAWVDRRFGASCGGTIPSPFAEQGATRTESCTYWTLDRLFAHPLLRVESSDVLVDVGCGKGRVLNYWLMRYPQNRLFGLELTPEVGEWVRARLASFANVNILIGDASQVAPAEGTVFFLFNPFGEDVMRAFARRLLDHCDRSTLRIVYLNARQLSAFDPQSWEFTDIDSASPDRCVVIRPRTSVTS